MADQTNQKDESFERPPAPGTESAVALNKDDEAAIAAVAELTGEASPAPRGERRSKKDKEDKGERKPARSKAPADEEEEEDEGLTRRDADYAKEADGDEEEEDDGKIDHQALSDKYRKQRKAAREAERDRAAKAAADGDDDEEEDPDLEEEEEEAEEEEDSEDGDQEEEENDEDDDEADEDLDDEDDEAQDSARPSAENKRPRPRANASGQQRPAPGTPGSGEGGKPITLFSPKALKKLEAEGFDKTLVGTLKKADQRFGAMAKMVQTVTRVAQTLIEQDTMQKGSALRGFLAAKAKEGFHDVYGKPGKKLTDSQDTALAKVITRANHIQRQEASEGNYISFTDALEAAHGTVNYKRSLEAARTQGRQDVESRIQKRHRKRDLVGGARTGGGGEREGGSGGGEDAEATAALMRFAGKHKIPL